MEDTQTPESVQEETTEQAPVNTDPVVESSPETPVKTDIITRLNKEAPKEKHLESDIPEDLRINSKELLEGIDDPKERKYMEQRIKDAEKGISAKFIKLSELKKDAESSLNQPWTQERITQTLNDPNFIQIAQTMVPQQQPSQAGDEDLLSTLTDEEQAAFSLLRKEAQEANKKVDSLLFQQQNQMNAQEHSQLQQKYTDYDQSKIDNYMQRVTEGRISTFDLKELVHLGTNYKADAQRFYEMGLKDGKNGLQEKVDGTTVSLSRTVPSSDDPDKPQKLDGESSKSLFIRLAKHKLLQSRK